MKPIEEIELLGCPFCGRKPDVWLSDDEPDQVRGAWGVACICGGCMEHVFIDCEGAIKAWNARIPSISYGDAVEKVSVAIIQRDIKGCGGEIMDRGKELAKAALAAMGIEEGK